MSGDDLPDDVFWTASEDEKTSKQWVDEFFPYTRARAAEHTRLEEEDGEEDDSLTSEYQFGMELDAIDMPRMVVWSPVPTVVYPKFMAEEEVKLLGDDGPYATEMREAIIGMRGCLGDAPLAAREDAELLLGYVESSNDWLMNHISTIHRCGEALQEGVGDVAALTTC